MGNTKDRHASKQPETGRTTPSQPASPTEEALLDTAALHDMTVPHDTDDSPRSQTPAFDERASDEQDPTFDYAQRAFAQAGLVWSPTTLRRLRLVVQSPLTKSHLAQSSPTQSSLTQSRDDDPDQDDAARTVTDRTASGWYTNTALLLSDQNPFALKCAVFEGDTKATMLDHLTVRGSVLRLIDEGMRFLERHDPEGTWPRPALRETLVNAIVHRDYDYSGPTLATVYDERIEIVSLGGLVDGLEVNDLLNGISQPRNARFADVAGELGFSENYGTGIARIMDAYGDSAASPQLRVGPSSMAVVLPRPVRADDPWPWRRDGEHDHESEATDAAADNTDKKSRGPHPRTARRYTFPASRPWTTDDPGKALAGARVIGVAPLQTVTLSRVAFDAVPIPQAPIAQPMRSLEAVTLHLFAESGVELSRGQIERRLGISKNQAAYVLRNLVNSGKITRRGRSRATHYALN